MWTDNHRYSYSGLKFLCLCSCSVQEQSQWYYKTWDNICICLKGNMATWALGSYKVWCLRRIPPRIMKQVADVSLLRKWKQQKQMTSPLLRGLFDVVSLCIWTMSIPFFFTSKKQRDNEIWCSFHNARIFGLWTTLEPQQDLGQHLLHTCLHQLHFQSICGDHSKSSQKASWVFVQVFQTRKLNC